VHVTHVQHPCDQLWCADVTFVVCTRVLLHTNLAEPGCQVWLSDYADILMRLAAAVSFSKHALALPQGSPTYLTLGLFFHLSSKLKGIVFSFLFCFATDVQCVAVMTCCQANSDHCCADEHDCKLQ